MTKDDRFWDAQVSDDFRFINHNESDFENFNKFQKHIDATFSKREGEKAKANRKANLEKWDASLAGRWQGAKLTTITKPVARKLLELIQKSNTRSFFLRGDSGSGKTFVAYAVIRRLIGKGDVTPSQVKIISESVLLSWASTGYKGQEAFTELFSSQYKLYLFDGIGTLDERESAKVAGLWEQIIEHVYSKDLHVIFTSTHGVEAFTEKFSHSAETKLRTLIHNQELTVEKEGSLAPPTHRVAPVKTHASGTQRAASKDDVAQQFR